MLYAAWSVLIYRLLVRVISSRPIAWVSALAVTLMMPLATFPFQFYPELAAGVLLFAVVTHLLFPRRGLLASFFYGLLAGYLPWLHVRFSAVTAVLVLTGTFSWRRDLRRALAFVAGASVPLVLFSLYNYRITGSIMPTALWEVAGRDSALTWMVMIPTSIAYMLDHQWGLFANAPVYLLALPGWWYLARRRPDVAGLSALVMVALVLPAGGHTLNAAATTPLRVIVAVVPLLALPLAELLSQYGRRRPLQVGFAVLLVASLHNALAYNLHHLKHVGQLVDRSFSGWKVHLLFPEANRDWAPFEVSTGNGVLYVVWLVVLLSLLAAPAIIDRARGRAWTQPPLRRSPPSLVRCRRSRGRGTDADHDDIGGGRRQGR